MIGWAYMTPRHGVNFCGNGKQFQVPIFSTKKEAIEWGNERGCGESARIHKVTVAVRRVKSRKRED